MLKKIPAFLQGEQQDPGMPASLLESNRKKNQSSGMPIIYSRQARMCAWTPNMEDKNHPCCPHSCLQLGLPPQTAESRSVLSQQFSQSFSKG